VSDAVSDAEATGWRLAVVVLAAGAGTRMRSDTPKVLHPIGGRSLLAHVLDAVAPLEPAETAVVVGHGRDAVIATLPDSARPVVQQERRGTGHAARLAVEAIAARGNLPGTVLVIFGDTPLLTTATLERLVAAHRRTGATATLLTAEAPDPTGYGRIIRDEHGAVRRVVEQRDASETERAVREINTGVAAFETDALRDGLKRLRSDNAAGEEYLPDVVAAFVAEGRLVVPVVGDIAETAGVNDRVQLAAAAAALRDRILTGWMRSGVSVADPATTWVDVGVVISPDAVLLPNVQLHGSTSIGTGALLGPDCTLIDTMVGARAVVCRAHCEGAVIGESASVGPFAYLRPGARIGRGAKVGAYVEVKAAELGDHSKVPHLSYVGDATIGADVNIGAGTIFANYDGVEKNRSTVGDGAKTGAHNTFVAPVNIGAGAYTGGGTVVRHDVPPGALAVPGGGPQRTIEGWTERKRPGTRSAAAAAEAATQPEPPDDHQPTESAERER